ncbi:hypothetical protein ABZ957_15020 [Streptomyces sp. NPDC046316]|uniref:hypothetical protein n=1 Tax=Streptomyces sp. NPDC046316 TaxID=3154494 RepID=UPI0033CFCFF9
MRHEYMHRAALGETRRTIEAELARPHERDLSILGVTAVASFAFSIIAAALVAIGLGWWSLLPAALLVPALALAEPDDRGRNPQHRQPHSAGLGRSWPRRRRAACAWRRWRLGEAEAGGAGAWARRAPTVTPAAKPDPLRIWEAPRTRRMIRCGMG